MNRPRLVAALVLVGVILGSVGLGFALTARGMATWDSLPHLEHSQWLVHKMRLPSSRTSDGLTEILKWYGPLWALFLGLMSEIVFRFLRDGLWVQQAFNFALYPVGLWALHRLLVRAGVARSTSRLAVALVFGAIRLGGHALMNVNDFPLAIVSLLAPLYLWNALRQIDAVVRQGSRVPVARLAAIGVVAAAPFLVRPPVLVEPAVVATFLAVYAALAMRDAPPARRIEILAVPLLAALVFGVSIWPALWERARVLPVRTAISGFTRFTWSGQVRAFGHAWLSTALPRWYPFIWYPVALGPATAIVAAVGLLRSLWRPPLGAHAFRLALPRGPVDLSLRRWMVLHVVLLWAGVLLLRPTLYDEDRHLLFLFPPLLVLGALAFDDRSDRLKNALALLVAVTSLVAYAQWGRYAYVYKSPLAGDRSASRFMGDYWGICVPMAIAALPGRVPPDAEVVVRAPYDAAQAQLRRLREGRFTAQPGFDRYRLTRKPSGPGAYEILYNRNGYNARELRAVEQGRATLIWQTDMPPGDPACVIVRDPA
jgi:hypothetical protein